MVSSILSNNIEWHLFTKILFCYLTQCHINETERANLMLRLMALLILSLCLFTQANSENPHISRKDFYITSDKNIRIFVREVRTTKAGATKRVPLLLLHGLRVPGLASFDLPVAGGSLAQDLVAAGYTVYIMDARGYGRSTRPVEMDRDPALSLPVVRSDEVVRDVSAVVEAICQRTKSPQIALLGWATGGHWLGQYASIHTERVSHLILYNTLYGATAHHPTLGHGSDLEDPQHAGQFNAKLLGSYRLSTAQSLMAPWDRAIPVEDKSVWRDPQVADAYIKAALDSDATSSQRTPNSLRSPNGGLEDSFYLAIGRQLWDASLIRARTLVLRSEYDTWSRPEDAKTLGEHLVHARSVSVVTIPQATHLAHLDRAEHGHNRLLTEIFAFLAN